MRLGDYNPYDVYQNQIIQPHPYGNQAQYASWKNPTPVMPRVFHVGYNFDNKRVWLRLNAQDLKSGAKAFGGTLKLPIPDVIRLCMDGNIGLQEWAQNVVVSMEIFVTGSGITITGERKITKISTNKTSYLIDFRIVGIVEEYGAGGNGGAWGNYFPYIQPTQQPLGITTIGTTTAATTIQVAPETTTGNKGWIKSFFERGW